MIGWPCSMCETSNFYMMLVKKPAAKRSLGRRRRRWKNSIKEYRDILGREVGMCVL
jgi:hypothetical protein